MPILPVVYKERISKMTLSATEAHVMPIGGKSFLHTFVLLSNLDRGYYLYCIFCLCSEDNAVV